MSTTHFLQHHGVKGMRWGVRKTPAHEVTTTQKPGHRVAATGGAEHPAHPDAIKAATSKALARNSTTDSLSTKDLQELVNRMNLEQQYSRLNPTTSSFKKGQQVVKATLAVGKSANEVIGFVNSPAGKLLKQKLAQG